MISNSCASNCVVNACSRCGVIKNLGNQKKPFYTILHLTPFTVAFKVFRHTNSKATLNHWRFVEGDESVGTKATKRRKNATPTTRTDDCTTKSVCLSVCLSERLGLVASLSLASTHSSLWRRCPSRRASNAPCHSVSSGRRGLSLLSFSRWKTPASFTLVPEPAAAGSRGPCIHPDLEVGAL